MDQELYKQLSELNESLSDEETNDKADLFNARGIELNNKDHIAFNNRGNCYRLLGVYRQALADYESALQLCSKYVDGWNNRGVTFFEIGGEKNYSQAVKCYNKALEIDCNDVFTYFNRGMTFCEQNRLEDAIGDFNEVLKRSPNDLESLFMRGRIYKRLQLYEQSKNDFERILEIDSNNENEEIYYELQNVREIIAKKKERKNSKNFNNKPVEDDEEEMELVTKDELIPINRPPTSPGFGNVRNRSNGSGKVNDGNRSIEIAAPSPISGEKRMNWKNGIEEPIIATSSSQKSTDNTIYYLQEIQKMKDEQIELIREMQLMKEHYDKEVSHLQCDRNELRSWNVEITKNLNKWSYTARRLNEEMKELNSIYNRERESSGKLLKETTKLKFSLREKEEVINQFRIYRVIMENELKKREKNLINSLEVQFQQQQQQQQVKRKRWQKVKEEVEEDEDEKHKVDAQCKICYEMKKNLAIVPCGHLLCKKCFVKIELSGKKTCPFCSQRYFKSMRIYL